MRIEIRLRCSVVGISLSIGIFLSLKVSAAEPLSSAIQDQLSQSCIVSYVAESMTTEMRETISQICHDNSIVLARLTEALDRSERERTMERDALAWTKNQGFEECIVGWSRTVRNKDVLVVTKPGILEKRMWTTDVPLGLSRTTLPESRRLCRWSYFGGPSSLIDSYGSEVSFYFADWIEE